MTKLIAIGGGEIGRPGKPIETLAIDKEIIKQSGKKHPNLLFIGTASKDSEGYYETIEKYFGKKLGCRTDVLHLVKDNPSAKTIKDKILSADIIYVGGGNTLYMIRKWKSLGIDKLLYQAYIKGTVMSGLSAGAICWFLYGTSDSRMITDPNYKDYIRVKGLGWYNIIISPHHITEKKRKAGLIKQIKRHGGIGLALDDYAAIEIINDKYKIITSKPIAKACKVYKDKQKLVYEELPKHKFLPLSALIKS